MSVVAAAGSSRTDCTEQNRDVPRPDHFHRHGGGEGRFLSRSEGEQHFHCGSPHLQGMLIHSRHRDQIVDGPEIPESRKPDPSRLFGRNLRQKTVYVQCQEIRSSDHRGVMRPDIGGHFHPRGDLDLPVFERIREVYANLQQYDEWVLDAVNEPEIALVYHCTDSANRPRGSAVESAVRMLTELKIQFDLVTEFASWDRYKLLVFPDDVAFTPSIAERVEAHLKRGGKIFASGRSGLDPEGKAFVLSQWPAVFNGPIAYEPLYFQPEGGLAAGLPDMPLSVYASGTDVTPAAAAVTEMVLVKPYLRFGWDGLRSNYYDPPQERTEKPFLVRNENIEYCSGELFTGYAKRAPKQLRQLLDSVIGSLIPGRKLKVENLPSFARAFVQKKGSTELVHLLAYCPEGRGQASALEDRITLVDPVISLRTDGRGILRVYLAPGRIELPFELKDGHCRVCIPQVTGYGLAVFEYETASGKMRTS